MNKLENFFEKMESKTIQVPKAIAVGYWIYATFIMPPFLVHNGNIGERNAEKQGIELMHTIYNTQGGNEMLNPAYYANNEDFL